MREGLQEAQEIAWAPHDSQYSIDLAKMAARESKTEPKQPKTAQSSTK